MQKFEIEVEGFRITPELLYGLLRSYLATMKSNASIHVEEKTEKAES